MLEGMGDRPSGFPAEWSSLRRRLFQRSGRSRGLFLTIFFAASMICAIGAVWFFQVDVRSGYAEAQRILQVSAGANAVAIQKWKADGALDAAGLGRLLSETHASSCGTTDDLRAMGGDLRDFLQAHVAAGTYSGGALATPLGDMVFTTEGMGDVLPESTREAIRRAVASGVAAGSRFFSSSSGGAETDSVGPIWNAAGEFVGVVVLRAPLGSAFGLLSAGWAVEHGVESLLAQREGEEVRVYSHSSSRQEQIQSIPIAHTQRPAVQAVLGGYGLVRGQGQFGESLLANVVPLAGTDWVLVQTIQEAPIIAAAWKHAVALFAGGGVLVLLFSLVVGNLYRRHQLRLATNLLTAERRLGGMAELMESAGELAHFGGWELEVATGSLRVSPEISRAC